MVSSRKFGLSSVDDAMRLPLGLFDPGSLGHGLALQPKSGTRAPAKRVACGQLPRRACWPAGAPDRPGLVFVHDLLQIWSKIARVGVGTASGEFGLV
jgi:hypothetical protein